MLKTEGVGDSRLARDGKCFVFERIAPYVQRGASGGTRLFSHRDRSARRESSALSTACRIRAISWVIFRPTRDTSRTGADPGAYVTGVFDLQTAKTVEFDVNVDQQIYQYPWVSSTQLAVRTSPPGQLSHAVERFAERLDRQAAQWKKARRGGEQTSSPVGSGRYLSIDARLAAEAGLCLLDVSTGTVKELAERAVRLLRDLA